MNNQIASLFGYDVSLVLPTGLLLFFFTGWHRERWEAPPVGDLTDAPPVGELTEAPPVGDLTGELNCLLWVVSKNTFTRSFHQVTMNRLYSRKMCRFIVFSLKILFQNEGDSEPSCHAF